MNNFNKTTVETHEKTPKDFSHVKIGKWVRFIVNDKIKYFTTTFNKWYQRIEPKHTFEDDNHCKYFWYKDNAGYEVYSDKPFTWDLTDIRDTNPDEPVQPNQMVDQPAETHEEIGYYPITKDNIVEVLEYNKIEDFSYSVGNEKITIYKYVPKSKEIAAIIHFNHSKWIGAVEFYFGKLNPIPKPKFNFVQYLLDNGWTSNNHNSACISSKRKTMMIVIKDYKFHHYDNSKQLYDCSEYNAKILVEMSNLGEKLSEELS